MSKSRTIFMCAAAAAAFVVGLSWNGAGRVGDNGFFPEAQARVGRPLTPMSYAGVARRTTRRAVAVGAGAAAAGAYYAPSCVQAVDAYGRVVTRC
jgi:hypothetical protein